MTKQSGIMRAYDDAYRLVSKLYKVSKPDLVVSKEQMSENNANPTTAYAVAIQHENKIAAAPDVEDGLDEYDGVMSGEDTTELTMFKLLVHELLHFSPGNAHENWRNLVEQRCNESVTELVAAILVHQGMKWRESPAIAAQVVYSNLLYRPTTIYVIASVIAGVEGKEAAKRTIWLLHQPPGKVVDYMVDGIVQLLHVKETDAQAFLKSMATGMRKKIYQAAKRYTTQPVTYILSLPIK